jgi:hypothetical protein
MTVSPSLISSAAARAIRSFSSARTFNREAKLPSGHNGRSSTAPPQMRRIMPSRSSRAKSLRIVTSETPSCSAHRLTEICP